jgi:hypothetical protein
MLYKSVPKSLINDKCLGNHDITLDTAFYQENWSSFHNQGIQDYAKCQKLLNESTSITYLNHENQTIHLKRPEGPKTVFTVFGSPYSPALGKRWAFQYEQNQAQELWKDIPLDMDIILTHAPPMGHCDHSSGRSVGCEELRKALWRSRPKLAICGHTHEGRGAERVNWKLDIPRCPYLEEGTAQWIDPGFGNKKLSLVDLTRRSGHPLHNYSSETSTMLPSPGNHVSFTSKADGNLFPTVKSNSDFQQKDVDVDDGTHHLSPVDRGEQDVGETLSRLDERNVEPLLGRMGRKETCIVNAAYMASSYGMPKRFNKPIVVDIELPVSEGDV